MSGARMAQGKKSYKYSGFTNFNNISELFFKLSKWDYWLEVLDLRYNNVHEEVLQKSFHSLQNTVRLIDVSNNRYLWNLTDDFVRGLSRLKLKILLIEHAHIRQLNFSVISRLKSLRVLNVSHNNISWTTADVPWYLTNISFLSNSLTELPRFCVHTNYSQLRFLDLRTNAIGYISNVSMKCLTDLEHISLENNFLLRIHSDTFSSLSNLHLHGNRIMSLAPGVFTNLTKLKTLNLSQNAIQVKQALEKDEGYVVVVLLENIEARNMTSSLLWFATWVKADKSKFTNFPESYRCGYPWNLQSTLLIDANVSEETCRIPRVFPIAYGLSTATVVLIVVISIAYKLRWRIRYYIHMLRYKKRKTADEERYIYDAFVVYCEADSRWKRSLEQDEGYLVVVLLEEIHARNMTSSLYALLQTTTYITWPVEEDDRQLFWMRLRRCLQR
ncbi:carboxypeptidase N subunit 2-like [Haliotis rufescens]|uniref:carboxypeptidase N subunit 2-like n=1 Tax=Haliotis rufescens TaxID=6454 RepID=UPI00201F099C|nr:carboxypeptidase N subunit 2-like [Haliotis rufescens]